MRAWRIRNPGPSQPAHHIGKGADALLDQRNDAEWKAFEPQYRDWQIKYGRDFEAWYAARKRYTEQILALLPAEEMA